MRYRKSENLYGAFAGDGSTIILRIPDGIFETTTTIPETGGLNSQINFRPPIVLVDPTTNTYDIGKYTHQQNNPSTNWTIIHGLGVNYPSMRVIDSNGNELVGYGVSSSNENVITLIFPFSVSGTAYLTP